MLGSLISAGASLVGGFMKSRSDSKARRQQGDEFNRNFAMNQEQFEWQKRKDTHGIRMQVRDARKAGLHPLFALGSSMNSSPVSFIPGQFETGSSGGDAIAAAGRAVGDYFDQSAERERNEARRKERQARSDEERNYQRRRDADLDDLQRKNVEAQVRRNEAEAILAQAQAKIAVQKANQTRPPISSTTMKGAHTQDEEIPRYIWTVDKSGKRRKILNPEAGLDEESQVFDVATPLVEYVDSVVESAKPDDDNWASPYIQDLEAMYHYHKSKSKLGFKRWLKKLGQLWFNKRRPR